MICGALPTDGLDAAGVLYGYGSREELEAFHPVLLAESCADLTDSAAGSPGMTGSFIPSEGEWIEYEKQ